MKQRIIGVVVILVLLCFASEIAQLIAGVLSIAFTLVFRLLHLVLVLAFWIGVVILLVEAGSYLLKKQPRH